MEGSEKLFISDIEAAKRIGSTVPTLRRWRHERKHLRFYKVGSSVRYAVADPDAFMEQRVVEPLPSQREVA